MMGCSINDFIEYVVCFITNQTFWTALSAIGTLLAVCYAMEQTHIAQKNFLEEVKKNNPQNWLKIDNCSIVRIPSNNDHFNQDTELELKLEFTASNKGFSNIDIIFIQLLFFSDKLSFFKTTLKQKLCLWFGSHIENQNTIPQYNFKRFFLPPFIPNSDILYNDFQDLAPEIFHEKITNYEKYKNKKIKAFIQTNIAMIEYELSEEEINLSLQSLIHHYSPKNNTKTQ